MNCKICNKIMDSFGKAKILGKYNAVFYRCVWCGFMQTEEPYWLEESYSKTITSSDIGLISRNLAMADATKRLILTFLKPDHKFIDYGGGYGMFVRLMRDAGFDYYRHDPLCENLFSVGFDAQTDVSYDLLTAWEVFEHLVNPIVEIEKMFSFSQNIFFSTQLLPSTPRPLGEWWYYGLEHGQHTSFYTKESLQLIAKRFDLVLVFSNGFMHWFGKKDVPLLLKKITFSRRYGWLSRLISKHPPASLLQKDFEMLTGIYMK